MNTDYEDGYNEGFGPLADIVRLLESISEKLDRNHATLQELLKETRNSNLALLNYGEENQRKETIALAEIDSSSVLGGSVLFVGYRRSELTEFLEKTAKSNGPSFRHLKGIDSPGDLAAVLTNCAPGDILLLNLEDIINSDCVSLIIDAIEDCSLDVKVGNGIGARSVRLDLPQIIIHFYAATDLFVPKELDKILTSIYSCTQ